MSTNNYTTSPQSSVNGNPARIVLENASGPISPSNPLDTTIDGGVGVTPSPHAMTAGQTLHIPTGAKNVSVIILTGTGTYGGVDLPVLLPYGTPGPLAAQVDVVTGTPGTARVFYDT